MYLVSLGTTKPRTTESKSNSNNSNNNSSSNNKGFNAAHDDDNEKEYCNDLHVDIYIYNFMTQNHNEIKNDQNSYSFLLYCNN